MPVAPRGMPIRTPRVVTPSRATRSAAMPAPPTRGPTSPPIVSGLSEAGGRKAKRLGRSGRAEADVRDLVLSGPLAGLERDRFAALAADDGAGERGRDRDPSRLDVGLVVADDHVGHHVAAVGVRQL